MPTNYITYPHDVYHPGSSSATSVIHIRGAPNGTMSSLYGSCNKAKLTIALELLATLPHKATFTQPVHFGSTMGKASSNGVLNHTQALKNSKYHEILEILQTEGK